MRESRMTARTAARACVQLDASIIVHPRYSKARRRRDTTSSRDRSGRLRDRGRLDDNVCPVGHRFRKDPEIA